jgi:hypothetical protein
VVFHQVSAGEWAASGGAVEARIVPGGVRLRDGKRRLDVDFIGASPSATVSGCGRAEGRLNFFMGDEPGLWRRGVPAYDCAQVRGLYVGIDLRLTESRGRLKSEYVLQPGVKPGQLRIRYSPASRQTVEADGSLRIESGGGVWREEAPVVYQRRGDSVEVVEGAYEVAPDGLVGFRLGAYDDSLPLVIDPVVTFSTLLGGNGISSATAVSVDASGFVYVAGYTDAADLPVLGPAQARAGGVEAYVAKIHASTGRLVYATYLGGAADDRAFAMAVDPMGSAYVAGWTTSANFPTRNAAQASLSGNRDGFLLKLSPAGDSLTFSTYFGGSQSETVNAVALAGNSVWIGGDTTSTNLPSATGWQNVNRGMQDGFVARFSDSGAAQVATYVGGNGDDTVRAVAVDGAGNVYAGGGTSSTDLSLPAGAAQSSLRGGQDGFVMKFDASGAQRLAGTYLGGSRGDWSNVEMVMALAVDELQNVYAAGTTPSGDFPTPSAWTGTLSGTQDGFLLKLNASFATVAWGTFLGGSGKESATALVLDPAGGVVVGGSTTSTNFPLQGAIQSSNGGGADGFVLRMNTAGSAVTFSTYLGGTGADGVLAVAMDSAGSVYVAGQSGSGDFRLKNPTQNTGGAALKMFVTRVAMGVVPSMGAVSADVNGAFTFTATHSGGASQIGSLDLLIGNGLTLAGGCAVRYRRDTGTLNLADNLGVNWTAVRPGVTESAENSQCKLTGRGSSVSSTGTTLTVVAVVSFGSSFSGPRQLYLNGAGTTGEESGFELKGNYTVVGATNQAPSAVSVSPSSGSGAGAIYSFTFSDPNGSSDVSLARMLFHTQISDVAGCSLQWSRASGNLLLADDAGTGWAQGAPGSVGTLQNSRCQLRLASSSVINSGTAVSIAVDLAFLGTFAGSKTIYGAATDTGGLSSAWTILGNWTASPVVEKLAPVAVSVTPALAAGAGQVFSFQFTDGNGSPDLAYLRVLINSQQQAAGGCYLAWDRANGVIWLANDAGTAWAYTARVGSSDVAANGQCAVRAAGSSIGWSGNTLTMAVDLTFQARFNGTQSIYANATDQSELTSPSPLLGSYTVSAGAALPFGPVSVSPNSGSGSGQVFTFSFSDPQGAADFTWMRILINAQQNAVAGCYVALDVVSRILFLANDAGTAWKQARVGVAETAANSQCTVRGATSSITLGGSTGVMVLDVSFQAPFNGAKSVWANATGVVNATSASPLMGTYTVSVQQPNVAPLPVSITPATGSGNRQAFTYVASDGNGGADITYGRILIHSQQRADSGCYVMVNRATGYYYLADDAGVGWAPVRSGVAESAQNSQCILYGAGSTFSTSGNNLSAVFDLGFKPGFAGAKSVWANATDSAGVTSASPQLASYTVIP